MLKLTYREGIMAVSLSDRTTAKSQQSSARKRIGRIYVELSDRTVSWVTVSAA
jgi:hypothetical protein